MLSFQKLAKVTSNFLRLTQRLKFMTEKAIIKASKITSSHKKHVTGAFTYSYLIKTFLYFLKT